MALGLLFLLMLFFINPTFGLLFFVGGLLGFGMFAYMI